MKRILLSPAAILGFLAMHAGCEGIDPQVIGRVSAEITLSNSHWDGDNESATQCNSMHCCPPQYAMQGAHFGNNVFRCAQVRIDEGSCYVDGDNEANTTRSFDGVSMHACPSGYYMKGYNAGADDITCCPYASGNAAATWYNDTGTQDAYPMHTCYFLTSDVMEGVKTSTNEFGCGY